MRILVLNAGSSTLKARCDDLTGPPPSNPPALTWKASAQWIDGDPIQTLLRVAPHDIDVVGHRVVHGGAIRETSLLTDDVRAAIALASAIAPEHNQRELQVIDEARRFFGDRVRQVAVFDTAFHATLAPPAFVYPGPYEWIEQGIRRFGFHGINHQYVSRRAGEIVAANAEVGDVSSLRVVTCHLGNGASLAAVRGGKCLDTTMGFTPIEGLMMGSRSGSIDPGILIYLMRQGHTADRLDALLNRESGLLGISGISADMREILAAVDAGHPRAQLAFEMYTHRLVREIGSMVAVLGGLDALVFTGGVGENCARLRNRVAEQVQFLNSRILVIPAEEEWEIARECWRLTSAR